ncbi:MAG TPA: NAD-dependent epimerase [Syntrophorhabdaceae bacterium]|nr:NAD-dependent epimerase [Syntrophorhabdaceae bacterium]
MRKILVTGAAGFIGFHVSQRLLNRGNEVTGVDNLNDYYDVSLKRTRLNRLIASPLFFFHLLDLSDRKATEELFEKNAFDAVIHLAAQAGVRYSLTNPHAYIASNVTGFLHVLEGCKNKGVGHLVFASSSSVYGANTKIPFSVHDHTDHPISLYAATKKAGELMTHTYATIYSLPCTVLRFFTVYGPWGRPDMAYFKFTRAILEDREIEVYGEGKMKRDFTYIDDVVEVLERVVDHVPAPYKTWDSTYPDPATSFAPYRVYNLGNQNPVELLHFINIIENCLGKKARLKFLPPQPGDVWETWADTCELTQDFHFTPSTPLEDGLQRFVKWYIDYHRTSRNQS